MFLKKVAVGDSCLFFVVLLWKISDPCAGVMAVDLLVAAADWYI